MSPPRSPARAGLFALLVWMVGTVTAAAQTPSANQGWTFYGAVYGWMSSVTGTVAVGPLNEFPVNEKFSDLAKHIDLGFSARFEAHSGTGWALFGDVFFADLGGEGTSSDSSVTVAVDQKELILEAGAGLEVVSDFEVLAVVRYNDLRLSAGVEGNPPVQGDTKWVDVFAGVRYSPALGERWLLVLRADAGGGGSQFSWFGAASINYWFNQGTSASLGYRILSVDRQEGAGFDQLKWDMTMHGLLLGVLFTF